MRGVPFSKIRWRKFYRRHQVFVTFCMECAYIDNLKSSGAADEQGMNYKIFAKTAIKNVGMRDTAVLKMVKKPHVR